MNRLREVLAFVNNKGGVAKTTSAHATAAALLKKIRNSKVLVIDLDPQGNLSKLLRFEIERERWAQQGEIATIADSLPYAERDNAHLTVYAAPNTPGLYFIPSDFALDNIGPQLNDMTQPNCALAILFGEQFMYHKSAEGIQRELMANNNMHKEEPIEGGVCKYMIEDEFDYVIIDCPPGNSRLHLNAMVAASGVVIPVQLEMMSVGGIPNIIESYEKVKKFINRHLCIRGLLMVMVESRLVVAKSLRDTLDERYSSKIFKSHIHRCADVGKAQCIPTSIVEFAPHCSASLDYKAFAEELINTYEE